MKKILCLLAVLVTAVALLSSCAFRDKEGTYTYHCAYAGNMQSAERAEQLGNFFDTFGDGYFAKEHKYTGKRSETQESACNDFSLYCTLIDEDTVLSYLEPAEQVVIYLLDSDGMQLMYCAWTKPDVQGGGE